MTNLIDLRLSAWRPKEEFYIFSGYKIGETFVSRHTSKCKNLLKEKIEKIKKGITNERNSEN
jgi:hypothetical protein